MHEAYVIITTLGMVREIGVKPVANTGRLVYSSLVVRLSLNSGYVKNDHWKLFNAHRYNVGK